mmetsp:Transcript_15985/g.15346  ORF Transcript_15985/g.15346 Transcript_15985/m.15346 type:complete len:322 (+) Transcript_15985:243-1208(+)|eukprot:CAMPEP_0119035996 /NCGR_PEP_ID=MMETSP1177-20130426/3323_1 /TAXON_ID=2985 /ORGANISM="Ochromonas sp, Strain CCMP1899" /LENGTH=321 /DNA_ID=CAMNT_0006995025 /DNA_START=143 /DNA_END=1108 /DNA_ORIENTATION=-
MVLNSLVNDVTDQTLDQPSRKKCRYAALIAQSEVCANRRTNPSVHPRLPSTSLFSTPGTNDNDMEGTRKCGALTHMDSAIAAHMISNDQQNRNHSDKTIRKYRGSKYGADSTLSDFQGDQLFRDAASLFADSERTGSGSSLDDNSVVKTDKPDSSCVRPEMPSATLLNHLRKKARHRHQQEIEIANSKEGINEEAQSLESLNFAFSSSALVSLGVLVEELTREYMVSWEERNALDRNKENNCSSHTAGPLNKLSQRTVEIEARLQLRGALFETSEEAPSVTPDLLRNRLEVLFGQDLSNYVTDINLVYFEESNRKSISRDG